MWQTERETEMEYNCFNIIQKYYLKISWKSPGKLSLEKSGNLVNNPTRLSCKSRINKVFVFHRFVLSSCWVEAQLLPQLNKINATFIFPKNVKLFMYKDCYWFKRLDNTHDKTESSSNTYVNLPKFKTKYRFHLYI